MRTALDKVIDGFIKAGVCTEDIIGWLNDNLTTREMSEQLAKTDFDRHFRIIGIRSDGQPETRGRKYSK